MYDHVLLYKLNINYFLVTVNLFYILARKLNLQIIKNYFLLSPLFTVCFIYYLFSLNENKYIHLINISCPTNCRLDFEGLKSHIFFKATNWDSILTTLPPFVPELHSIDDVSHFDYEDLAPRWLCSNVCWPCLVCYSVYLNDYSITVTLYGSP